jgi:hypothetical protein
MRLLSCLVATSAIACFSIGPAASAADEWGSIEGQFVFDGDIPVLAPLIKKGDAAAKDATVCAVADVPDESLIVNPNNKGIANVFLYIRKAPSKIHPDLKASSVPEVVFDQKGCQFFPHAMILRTDQTVLVKSGDSISHNTHTNPFGYKSENLIIAPNDRKGVPIQIKESQLGFVPVKINCDIHPHMVAWWLVSDHPYVAITDNDGKFKIDNVPVGEHTFRVWHERLLYIKCPEFQKDVKIKVEADKTTTVGPFKVKDVPPKK